MSEWLEGLRDRRPNEFAKEYLEAPILNEERFYTGNRESLEAKKALLAHLRETDNYIHVKHEDGYDIVTWAPRLANDKREGESNVSAL